MTTHTYFGTLTIVECASCHMNFGLPPEFERQLRRTSESFWCPQGHSLSYPRGKTAEQKLADAESREIALNDQLQAAGAEAEKARAALIRDRYRFSKGVCPCCNRTFPALGRHMATQHPEYDPGHLKDPVYACSCGRSFSTPHGLRVHQGRVRPDNWASPKASRWSSHLTVTA